MTQRSQAEAFILEYVDKVFQGGANREFYENLFKDMSDSEFDLFMKRLERKEIFLVAYVPNLGSTKVTLDNNLKVAQELGHDFFQKLWIGPKNDEPAYLTPIPYLVINLPLRRQSQHLIKKRSIPDNDQTVDQLTGQPTGPSKGAKISYPELQVLAGMNMDNSITELIKYRGGDKGGYHALNALMSRYGVASLGQLKNYATGVESTKTFRVFLTSMHLKSTL